MKYLKTFESNRFLLKKLKYKAGDYILIDDNTIIHNDLDTKYAYIGSTDKSEVPYRGVWPAGYDFWLKEEEIERLLTPEEIETYNELKNITKYNL